MSRLEQIKQLNRMLLAELPQYREQAEAFPPDETSQRRLLRSLMNVRPPVPASAEFLAVQDAYLRERLAERGVTRLTDLTPMRPGMYLWQGDITTLAADAIVNAANSQMLGCFVPCHGCIDNAIHTYAGLQLRLECAEIMRGQGHEEETGRAKITKAYNLPCGYVIHTVGPIVGHQPTPRDRETLISCYRSCMDLARQNHLQSIAFCCISTGEFHYPNREAAEIAVQTVQNYKRQAACPAKVVFNVFKDVDEQIYQSIFSS